MLDRRLNKCNFSGESSRRRSSGNRGASHSSPHGHADTKKWQKNNRSSRSNIARSKPKIKAWVLVLPVTVLLVSQLQKVKVLTQQDDNANFISEAGPKPRDHVAHPRLVDCLGDELLNHLSILRNTTKYIPGRAIEYKAFKYMSSGDYYDSMRSSYIKGDCVPMHEWQVSSFPTCNNLHEMDLTPEVKNLVFINSGGSRSAFLLYPNEWSGRQLVLKNLKFTSDFTDYHYEEQRIDALGMERLSASPYVMEMYGHCGVSVITEYSNGGNLHDLVKSARLGGETLSAMDKLRVAAQVAQGVADMHSFEPDKRPSFTHQDICCHQFLYVDGVFKLNDFNHAKFLKVDKNTNETCKEKRRMKLFRFRTPDEMLLRKFELDKVDIYLMGNVLFYILTNHWLFEGYSQERAMEKVKSGQRSSFPTDIQESTDPAIVALKMAITLCWTHDPDARPAASHISSFLMQQFNLLAEEGDSVVRVELPPRDENQALTDSDFYNFL